MTPEPVPTCFSRGSKGMGNDAQNRGQKARKESLEKMLSNPKKSLDMTGEGVIFIRRFNKFENRERGLHPGTSEKAGKEWLVMEFFSDESIFNGSNDFGIPSDLRMRIGDEIEEGENMLYSRFIAQDLQEEDWDDYDEDDEDDFDDDEDDDDYDDFDDDEDEDDFDEDEDEDDDALLDDDEDIFEEYESDLEEEQL